MLKYIPLLSAILINLTLGTKLAFSQSSDDEKIIILFDNSPSDLYTYFSRNIHSPGIGLALSGGGSRALAHIGVLNVFDSAGVDIKIISGVSMGGIIGGLYSAGYTPKQIEEIALSIRWSRLLSQSPVRSSLPPTRKDRSEKSIFNIRFESWHPVLPKAITTGQNLRQYLETLASRSGIRPSISFDYLDPPLRIVTTDLSTGEKVVLQSGSLAEAMRATMAVPLAFTPISIDGRLLVDGGLVDPIPVDAVKGNFNGPVIAVDVSSELLPASMIEDVIDIADQTTTIMSMQRRKDALELVDLVVRPDLPGKLSTDFSDIHSIINAGEAAAREALPRIKSLLNRQELPKNSPGYPILSWDIDGLVSMPRTFFMTAFIQSDSMTADAILLNLRVAFESGYLRNCRAELSQADSGYHLRYHLDDNARIDRIEFREQTVFPADSLRRIISLKRGMVLNHVTALSDGKAIEDLYIASGYSLARVTTQFMEAGRILEFVIDEGRINKVTVEGNDNTRDWVIRRHIPFDAGDLFTQRKADRGVEDLYATDLFETARFIALPDTTGITLKAIVAEKAFKFLRSGARYDLEYGPQAFIDLVDDNLFGADMEFYLSTVLGEKRRSASLTFEADRIWNTLYTYKLVADYGELKRNYYLDHDFSRSLREFRHGGELSLGRQIPRLGTIFVVGEIRRYRWDEAEKPERQLFDKTSIGFRSIVDTRDDLDFPEGGKYHYFDLQIAGNLSDKKSAYTRYFTSLESYYELSDRLNFHPKISLGISSNFMPYFDKFTLGGVNDFPGLYQDEIVGEKTIVGEFGLRYRILGRIYLVGCYTYGNNCNRLESIRFSKLRNSVAAGLALGTPLGPIRCYYARTSRGLDAIYFSVGYDW